MTAISPILDTTNDLYFGLFYLYFWRAPPVVYTKTCIKRPREEAKNPWPFLFHIEQSYP